MKKIFPLFFTIIFFISISGCSAAITKTERLRRVETNGPDQFLSNANFEEWKNEIDSPPKNWGNLYGKIRRDYTTLKRGKYTVKLVSPPSEWGYLKQEIALTEEMNDLKGKPLTFSAWVKCSKENGARIELFDGKNTWNSPWHKGDSKWHLLEVTGTPDKDTVKLIVALQVVPGSTKAYFDDTLLIKD